MNVIAGRCMHTIQWLALCGIAFMGAACATVTPTPESVAPSAGPTDAPADYSSVVVGLIPTQEMHLMARTEGELAVDGRCLVIVLSDGTIYETAWLSPDMQWDATTGTVTIGGRSVRVGDHIAVGGGEGSTAGRTLWVQQPPPECQRELMWYVHDLL